MYAVIRTGGKQYRVTDGGVLKVEKLDAEEGATIEFDEVLMVGNGDKITVGKPLVKGGKVTATVEEQGRGRKIEVIKFKRWQGYKRNLGHRQAFTRVKVTGIVGG